MNDVFLVLAVVLPVVAVGVIAFATFNTRIKGKSAKKSLRFNLVTFLIVAVLVCTFAFFASAQSADPAADAEVTETAQTEETAEKTSSNGLGLLAAGLVTGLAGIGGGIAVAAGAPAAIAATSEDPKSFGKSLIFVALGESIALYGVVISILILNKI